MQVIVNQCALSPWLSFHFSSVYFCYTQLLLNIHVKLHMSTRELPPASSCNVCARLLKEAASF